MEAHLTDIHIEVAAVLSREIDNKSGEKLTRAQCAAIGQSMEMLIEEITKDIRISIDDKGNPTLRICGQWNGLRFIPGGVEQDILYRDKARLDFLESERGFENARAELDRLMG